MLSLGKATVLMGTKRTVQFQDSVEAGGQLGDCLTLGLGAKIWGQGGFGHACVMNQLKSGQVRLEPELGKGRG